MTTLPYHSEFSLYKGPGPHYFVIGLALSVRSYKGDANGLLELVLQPRLEQFRCTVIGLREEKRACRGTCNRTHQRSRSELYDL